MTTEERRAKDRARYLANREQILAQKKAARMADPEGYRARVAAYREANRERVRASNRDFMRRWAAANPEKKAASDRRHYEANRERLIAYGRRHASANREAYRTRAREWYHANKQRAKATVRDRKARVKGSAGVATVEQIAARVEYYGGRCAYCGGPFQHLDHVIPLSRGGTGWPANLRPACAPCNLSKKDRPLVVFLQHLSEQDGG